jgi:DNA polymerase III sliding clamp (beta) subunit (PCNA family)
MQIKVNIKVLREGIAQASHTLDTKASSIGSWLHFIAKGTDTLYLYSNNMGTARTLLKIKAEVVKEGECLILPKLLQSILVTLPDKDDIELALSASGAKLQVKYESLKSEIAVAADAPKSSEIFKTIPFNAKPNVFISAASLVSLIDRLIFCVASGDNAISEGPWLSSAYLETGDNTILGVATNRIIAGQAEIHDGSSKYGLSSAIHRDALLSLSALLAKRDKEEVTITNASINDSTPTELLFRFSDVILGVRLLSTPYPVAVKTLFTKSETLKSVEVNREALIDVMSRLKAFAENKTFSLTLSGDKATLMTRGYNSVFQEQIPLGKKIDDSITIGLGIVDVSNSISIMASEDVVIKYKSDSDHIYLQEGESNYKYILSPVALSWKKDK